jgi:low temperature viability protein
MLLLHLMMMNSIMMLMKMLLTMILCLKLMVLNHLLMMNVMNSSKIIKILKKIFFSYLFILRDEIIKESLPTNVPPLFVPKTNKPIPLALRRFLDQDDQDDDDDMDSNYSHNDDDKQTSKTKYTNYSMTSSVIRRNQGLQNVDDHFDKVFDQYDDEQIGPLDSYHINQQGMSIEDDLLKQTVEQFEQQQMTT